MIFANSKAVARVVENLGPYYTEKDGRRTMKGYSIVAEYSYGNPSAGRRRETMRKTFVLSHKPVVGETEVEVLYWPGRPERAILRTDRASRILGMLLALIILGGNSAGFGYAGFVLPIQIFFFGSSQGQDICPGVWHAKLSYFIAIVPIGAIPGCCFGYDISNSLTK
jgi:hypothetical protein